MGRILVDRIRTAAASGPFYSQEAEAGHGLYWAWARYGPRGEVEAYLRGRFSAEPNEVHAFLSMFAGVGYSMETGIPHRSDFRRDHYDAVASIVHPGFIMEVLRGIYGSTLDQPGKYSSEEPAYEEQLAHQFAEIHVALQRSGDVPTDSTASESNEEQHDSPQDPNDQMKRLRALLRTASNAGLS